MIRGELSIKLRAVRRLRAVEYIRVFPSITKMVLKLFYNEGFYLHRPELKLL